MSVPFGNIETVMASALEVLAPPPELTVSQWADKYRRLSAESSAMPGIYRTSVTEYMREPMDMVGKPGVRRITCMFSAQVAKSTFIENAIGYLMHYDPCPILHVSPTLSSMKMFSKERLSPMLRDSPSLSGLVKNARSRDSDNTIDTKKFPGGNLAMVGSNAPAGLASRPVRAVFFDEVDRFERSAGTEGDPILLAIKRTTTYWNRVIIMVSTPGDKGVSRIEEEYERGDQRHFYVPCPCCGHKQRLRWEQVVGFKKDDGTYDPEAARYECEYFDPDTGELCGARWDDQERNAAVKLGEWCAEKPWNGNVSYHLNQLYSPFAPLADGVRDFLDAKGNPEALKTWVNTFLGETWEDIGERLDHSDLMDQREEYDDTIPEEVTLLTASVDVQDDRLEYEILGWGDDARTWSIKYDTIPGDLSTAAPWDELRSVLKQVFTHPIFGDMAIRATCIDTGGHYTRNAYTFSTSMQRVFAIKGIPGMGRPMVGRPSRNNIGKVQLFPVGVDTIKETVSARLRVRDSAVAGYCAFPMGYDEKYFLGITAEKLMTKFHKGRKKQEWVPIRKRNEPFDLRVYNTAALEILGVDLNAQRKALLREAERAREVETEAEPEKPYVPSRSPRIKGNWASRWRDD